MAIKDWPTQDRPREKLLALGPAALSDTELLAILLRTGAAGSSAVELARASGDASARAETEFWFGYVTYALGDAKTSISRLRQARGESVRGYKIGFTNRGIWPRYRVNAPIWGPVWDSTLSFCEGDGQLDLDATCQPRIEPECVLGFARTPPPQADEQAIYDCLDWVASGFEIVQSHQAH